MKYDSVYGRFPFEVKKVSDKKYEVNGQVVKLTQEKLPESIQWGEMSAQNVMECTGAFLCTEHGKKHLSNGKESYYFWFS